MKLKKNFTVYNMDDDYLLVPTGEEMGKFGGTVLLNDVSAFLVHQIEGKDRTLEQLVQAILGEYDVDEHTAEVEVAKAMEALKKCGVIEE